MKISAFIIFITIVTVVYGLTNFYIFHRALQAIPQGNAGRIWFIVVFWALASCFILSRFLERAYPGVLTDVVTWIGSLWLAIMLYGFIYVLLIDVTTLIFRVSGSRPFAADNVKTVLFYTGIAVIAITVMAGFINARTQRVKKLDLVINKSAGNRKELRIAMASDVHLGTLIGSRGTKKLVKKINSLNPDIILLAGDVVDEDLMPVIRRNLGERLKDLKAPLGVYAITGNHEYIGGAEKAVKYLEEHGIRFLRDSVVFINGEFYIAGREDRDIERFSGKHRKSVADLLEGVDRNYPVILMDHQPFQLEVPVKENVDLQLSGHTHHGQLWPFNYITNAIYTISTGYGIIGNTHFYVSTGFGSWGPPVRLGNRPEVVEINLKFK